MDKEGVDAPELEAVVDPQVVDGEVQSDPVPAPAPDAPKPKGPNDPLISTITQLRAERRAAQEESARWKREAEDAKALAERLSRAKGDDKAPPAPGRREEPAANNETEVQRQVRQQILYRDTVAVRAAGDQAFGSAEFLDSLRGLEAVGGTSDDVLQQIIDVDRQNAHVIINELGKDLEKAASLMRMPETRRMAELTRMAVAIEAKNSTKAAADPAPAKSALSQVSKAPPPAPKVAPSSKKEVDWRSDEATDEEFDRGFWENVKRRQAVR